MVLLSTFADHAFGREYQAVLGRLYAAPGNSGLPVAPYFPLLAAVAAKNWVVALIVCLGFGAWAFFWLPATLVYAARTLLAWSFDRVAPAPLGNVHPRWHTPTTALGVVIAANLVFLALFLFTTFFSTLILVLAAMLAWIPTMYAAIVFPYRNRRLFEVSAIAGFRIAGIPAMTVAGVLGLVAVLIVTIMLWNDSVAAGHSPQSLLTIAAVFGAGLLWYALQRARRRREGLDISRVFKQIPIE
jgi:amino acid transporter